MKNWYEVYVEFFDTIDRTWKLSAITWWKFLIMKIWNVCGSARTPSDLGLEYNIYYVPKKNVKTY